jgi:hypothetical protein
MATLAAGSSVTVNLNPGDSLVLMGNANTDLTVTQTPVVPFKGGQMRVSKLGPPAFSTTFGPVNVATAFTLANAASSNSALTYNLVSSTAPGEFLTPVAQATSFTALVGQRNRIDTTAGAVTVTLPVSPVDGALCSFVISNGYYGVTFTGGTILGGVTTMNGVGSYMDLQYNAALSQWEQV